MPPPFNPPAKNQDFQIRVTLDDYLTPGRSKVSPTLATGDFKIDKDGGGLNNLATLPTVSPSGTQLVLIQLSATEMNADVVTIVCKDQTTPPEWTDLTICVVTTQ